MPAKPHTPPAPVETFRVLRIVRGFSQIELAHVTEGVVGKETISQIECGKLRNPRYSTVSALARALGLHPDQVWAAIMATPFRGWTTPPQPVRGKTRRRGRSAMRHVSRTLVLLLLLLTPACGDETETPTRPDPAVATVNAVDLIEFRVVGNAVTSTVRYTTSIDGTAQVTTGLPFSVTVRTSRERVFLSLDVSVQVAGPALNTFVIAQIFVNGSLFREAYGSGQLPTVTASGTFTHGQQVTAR